MQAIYFEDMVANCIPQILHEIYGECVYEPFLKGRTGLTILDVGANIGLFSHYVLTKGYAKKVLAVEPSTVHISCMESTMVHLGVSGLTFRYVLAALSDKDGDITLYKNEGNKTTHNILGGDGDQEVVRSYCMESLLNVGITHEYDFMKMDVEGAEGLIVQSESFQRAAPHIKEIVGEYHSWCPVNREDFAFALEQAGYHFRWLPGYNATQWHAKRRD